MLEGLISNFFVVMPGGEVWTAPDKVLNGHARELVLQVCRENGIAVKLKVGVSDRIVV